MNFRRLLGCGAAALLLGVCSVPAQGQVLSEGFDNINTLVPAGWVRTNRSNPLGSTAWFQGSITAIPDSQSGPPGSYIGANFNNTGALGTISNWLMTPPITLQNTMQLKFYTQAVSGTFPDRLQVRMSTAGNSSNVGAGEFTVGDFTTLLLDINPTYSNDNFPTGYPFDYWQEYTVTVVGVPAPTLGRLAFRYFVENAGASGANSNLIGIDSVSISEAINPCLAPLPFCAADVFPFVGDDVVNIDDLLVVIGTWAQNGNPNGPRPVGDCAPGATGDCIVNIDDILKVIGQWGNCPIPTGGCCIQGSCSVLTFDQCSAQFGSYLGDVTNCVSVVCPTPPPGDLCVNPLIATDGANNWNNTNANTDGPTVSAACGGGGTRDVWFKYTASCTGNVTFDTVGTAAPFTETVLQVFNGTGCNPVGALLGCNDDIDGGGGNLLSRVTIAMASGQEVLVRCMGHPTGGPTNFGPAILNIGCVLFNNDLCGDADLLSIPGTVSASIQGSSDDEVDGATNCLPLIGNPPAQPPLGSGRWYRVVGNGNIVTASTCPTITGEFETWDGRLAVYCGLNCPDLTCVVGSSTFDCGPSGNTNTGFHERVSWCSKLDQSYWILVAGDIVPKVPDGGYTLVLSSGAACANPLPCGLIPQNNNCANAIPINNGTTSYSTVFATTDGTNNLGVVCADSGGTNTVRDIWYTYTATCTGVLTVSTCAQVGGASNYDTDLVLYPASAVCPPLAAEIVACNDDDPSNPCGGGPLFQSTLFADVTAGQTYRLRVGGWANAADFGTGILSVTCTVPVCGNGIIEAGEQCDDNNNVPNDGCTNCQVDAICTPDCTFSPVEACVVGPDTVNGGCNTTPALYTNVTLTGGTAVVCAEAWATPIGTSAGNRDLDWYTVTVGASGRVEAHITSTSDLTFFAAVGTADALNPCENESLVVSAAANEGQCQVVFVANLDPGSTAIVVAFPTTFNGFPCDDPNGPWTYKLRIVSP